MVYKLYPLSRHLANTSFRVTDGDASPCMDWNTQCDTIPIDHTDITGTSGNEAQNNTIHIEMLLPARFVFASDTRRKTRFPRYGGHENTHWTYTNPGHSRQVVIIDDAFTSLVRYARCTIDSRSDAQPPGFRSTCFRGWFWTGIRSGYIPQVYYW